MANGYEIRERIASITETKKVTDAMYRISSAKMQKALREMEKTRPYFEAVQGEIAELLHYIPKTDNRYFHVPEPEAGSHGCHGILLVTSDRGLSGGYNETAIRTVVAYMDRHPETVVFILGEHGRQYFSSRHLPFDEEFRYCADLPTVWEARRICADLLEYYRSGRVDDIHIIFTDFRNGRAGECRNDCLLPLERTRFPLRDNAGEGDKEFFPTPDEVLEGIVPSYLTGYIYSSLVDSYCSEQQARMIAMSTAGDNAEDMLQKLQLQYNSVRQAAITREMTEITAGVRGLKRKREAMAKQSEGNGKR